MVDVRLIIDPPLPGPWNMAVDDVLLADAVKYGVATLRFYQWSEPTLSLGYFQRYDDRELHPASRACPVVRRQSGGGAILHDRELTYSFVVPANLPLTRNAPALYERVHQAFIAALTFSSHPTDSRKAFQIRGEAVVLSPSAEPFLCFQRQSSGDVVLTNQSAHLARETWKVLGSAQRRHRGAILQHGSLLIQQSDAAPELPGLCELIETKFTIPLLIPAICNELIKSLEIRLNSFALPPDLQSKAAELANLKYESAAWTKRR